MVGVDRPDIDLLHLHIVNALKFEWYVAVGNREELLLMSLAHHSKKKKKVEYSFIILLNLQQLHSLPH